MAAATPHISFQEAIASLINWFIPPSSYQVLCRGGPSGKEKLEAGIYKTARRHTAAFEHQFRFCLHEVRADFDHPLGTRQSKSDAPSLAQPSHKIAVWQRIR